MPVAGGECVNVLVAFNDDFSGDLVKHVSFVRSLTVDFLAAGGW